MDQTVQDFTRIKNDAFKDITKIYEAITKIFNPLDCEKEAASMSQALESIKNVCKIEPCLKAVMIFRKEVEKGNEFKNMMKKLVDNKIKKAVKQINEINTKFNADFAQSQAKFTKDQAPKKYLLAHEYITQILQCNGQFRLDMTKIREDIIKCDSRQKKQIEYIQIIDTSLVENIIPEVKRRHVWTKLDSEFMTNYKAWSDKEKSMRTFFEEQFKFKEIPEVFGTLLDPENQYETDEVITASDDYKDMKGMWKNFFEKHCNYYEWWRAEYKNIATKYNVSAMRRENKDLKEKLEHLQQNFNFESECNANRAKEIDSLRSQVQESLQKVQTIDSTLLGEKATTDELRKVISSLQQNVAGLESMVSVLKSEKASLQNELDTKTATFKTQTEDKDRRLIEMESQMKAHEDTIYDKKEEIAKRDDAMNLFNQKFEEIKQQYATLSAEKDKLAKELSIKMELNNQYVKQITALKEASTPK
jgi:hypothetical protein